MQKLDSFDSGANYQFGDKMLGANVPRSMFDLSHLVTTTIDNAGQLIPLPPIETVPNDSFDISVRSLLRVMPQVVPLYSRQRLYVHCFWSSYSSLQSDFQTLITKGYNGNTVKEIAPITAENFDSTLLAGNVKAGDLADYFGIPQGVSYSDLVSSEISCLPFMMYERIWRDYFCNKNYYIDNRTLLPDNDDDFRVNGAGEILSDDGENHIYFGKLHYRDYPDDYFTSALPWAQRGDAPTLDFSTSVSDLFKESDTSKLFRIASLSSATGGKYQFNVTTLNKSSATWDGTQYGVVTGFGSKSSYPPVPGNDELRLTTDINVRDDIPGDGIYRKQYADLFNSYINDELKIGGSMNLDAFRGLAVAQLELERLARCDGTYFDFGLTFFGRPSKSAHTNRPVYVGGSYQPISFTEVLQTSATSESSALGQYAGHGICADNQGYIGHFDCDDYGLLMFIISIMPDTYYHQGLDKVWTRKLQSEFFLPGREKLGLQPILNQEILYTGTSEDDLDLFGYQNPFDDMRYRMSRITGKIADSNSLSFFPYTQARHFESQPTLSQSFAIADDVRKDYLYAPSECAYSAQFSLDIRAVRPLPYKPVPAQIIN